MKKCPFCAEDVQAAAIKCKHCGEMIVAAENHPAEAVTLASKSRPTPLAALGSLVVFAGLWFLLMGVSEYYGGSSTRDMYRGTVLENDEGSNRITENFMSAGLTKIGIGLVLILSGGVIAAAGAKGAGDAPLAQVPSDSPKTYAGRSQLGDTQVVAASLPAARPSDSKLVAASLLICGNLFAALVGAVMVSEGNSVAPTVFLVGVLLGTPGFGLLLRGNLVVRWGGGFVIAAMLTILVSGIVQASS